MTNYIIYQTEGCHCRGPGYELWRRIIFFAGKTGRRLAVSDFTSRLFGLPAILNFAEGKTTSCLRVFVPAPANQTGTNKTSF